MAPLKFISLGSCLVSEPVGPLSQSRRIESVLRKVGLRVAAAYSLDEAIMFIRFLRGELDIPSAFRPLCDISPDWQWQPAAKECLAECEMVLVEIYSPIRIGLGPYSFVRGSLISHIADPLRAKREDMRKPLHAWWYQGLLAGNEVVRAEMGEVLAAAVDDQFPSADVVREVLRNALSYRRTQAELIEGIATLQRLIDRPVGLMMPIHQYLPDGRQVPWPPQFIDETFAVAQALGLPIFEPAKVVKDYGVDKAWKGPNGPYQEGFWPVLADALFPFMQSVAAGASAPQREPVRLHA